MKRGKSNRKTTTCVCGTANCIRLSLWGLIYMAAPQVWYEAAQTTRSDPISCSHTRVWFYFSSILHCICHNCELIMTMFTILTTLFDSLGMFMNVLLEVLIMLYTCLHAFLHPKMWYWWEGGCILNVIWGAVSYPTGLYHILQWPNER